jgi:hypothetical protein
MPSEDTPGRVLRLARQGKLWPDGRRFAFSIFDDPDGQTTAVGREIYAFLRDCGLRTTRGCWPAAAVRQPSDRGHTCGHEGHAEWLRQIRDEGFELGLHNVTNHTSFRDETIAGFNRFRELFGSDPVTMSNHFANDEGIYFGEARLSGWRLALYTALTLGKWRNHFRGHVEGDPLFWGDICRERMRYVRNFVFHDIDTLSMCPWMPYHDPQRPYVRFWYCSAEGTNCAAYLKTVTERAIDKLEEQGGACILYVHFGKGFYDGGGLNADFRKITASLGKRNGWFVPVGTLLDHLRQVHGQDYVVSNRQRAQLETRWLLHKIRHGSS